MDIEEKRQEISDMLNDLTDEQVLAMWAVMNAQYAQRWVIRVKNGALPGSGPLGRDIHPFLYWNPSTGWETTTSEARQYSTELGANRAVSWFHGRRWQRDMVEVVRVTP